MNKINVKIINGVFVFNHVNIKNMNEEDACTLETLLKKYNIEVQFYNASADIWY